MLDPKVFKAYDVRGIYPTELDEGGAYAIGHAFVEQFEPRRIAVGHDMRLSSPAMAEAFTNGAAEAGTEVLRLGLVGTEMVYFAVGELGLDGGAAVTASHNPMEYTGMKIVRAGALPVGGESGLLEVRDRALAVSDRSRSRHPRRRLPTPRWVGLLRSRHQSHPRRRRRVAPVGRGADPWCVARLRRDQADDARDATVAAARALDHLR